MSVLWQEPQTAWKAALSAAFSRACDGFLTGCTQIKRQQREHCRSHHRAETLEVFSLAET